MSIWTCARRGVRLVDEQLVSVRAGVRARVCCVHTNVRCGSGVGAVWERAWVRRAACVWMVVRCTRAHLEVEERVDGEEGHPVEAVQHVEPPRLVLPLRGQDLQVRRHHRSEQPTEALPSTLGRNAGERAAGEPDAAVHAAQERVQRAVLQLLLGRLGLRRPSRLGGRECRRASRRVLWRLATLVARYEDTPDPGLGLEKDVPPLLGVHRERMIRRRRLECAHKVGQGLAQPDRVDLLTEGRVRRMEEEDLTLGRLLAAEGGVEEVDLLHYGPRDARRARSVSSDNTPSTL